jgi:undecaprenyl-diphosphatase
VTLAVILAAVVAAMRVYLRAHYLTDVLGGLALGATAWALAGVLGLFAGHVRNNERAAS